MKTALKFLAVALGAGLAFTAPSAAQAQVGVNVQIGVPAWGPPVPQGTQYYYIPEIDGYYDIYNQVYLVFDGVQWVTLPYVDGYDPYYFHPVPVSYVGPQPWAYIGRYRSYYPQYVTGWRRGGYPGRYYAHDYGAGRVYGYGTPGAGYPRSGPRGGGGFPGYGGGQPQSPRPPRAGGFPGNGNQPGNNFPGNGNQPGSNFPGNGNQPGNNFPGNGNQPGNNFPGNGNQPGPGNGGPRGGGGFPGYGGGQPGGGGNRGGADFNRGGVERGRGGFPGRGR